MKKGRVRGQDYFEKNRGHSCHMTYKELEHQ